MSRDPVYVIYHSNCPDGLAASWVYLHYHKTKGISTDHIKLIPASAGKAPTNLEWSGTHVILLDISFKRSELLDIASKALTVKILDHHQSASTELSGEFPPNVTLKFDMNRCGAQLAWDEWFSLYDYPWFINAIADRDLWAWKDNDSRPIGKYLFEKKYFGSHEEFGKLINWGNNEIEHAVTVGKTMIEIDEKNVEHYVSIAIPCILKAHDKDYKVYLTGCPHNYASEVGNALCSKDCDFAVAWRYDFEKDEWYLSCRATKNEIDLSVICSKFASGGGHKKAAGFTIKGSDGNLHSIFKKINP